MFAFDQYPRRLNLGCGLKHLPGYVNVDRRSEHNPDLVADVVHLSMLPDDYYEEVIAHDLLEHIERTRTLETLAEWNRVMRLDGRLELKVPSLLDLLALFRHPDHQGIPQQKALVRCLFGSQAYSGDYHFTAFTPALLEHYLERAGFAQTETGLSDEWLLQVSARKFRHLDRSDDLIFIPDADVFLTCAYRTLLGREADAEGRRHYLGLLRAGDIAKETVLESLMGSEEYQARQRDVPADNDTVAAVGDVARPPSPSPADHVNTPASASPPAPPPDADSSSPGP